MSGTRWAHEIKWDGYRAQAHVADGKSHRLQAQRPRLDGPGAGHQLRGCVNELEFQAIRIREK